VKKQLVRGNETKKGTRQSNLSFRAEALREGKLRTEIWKGGEICSNQPTRKGHRSFKSSRRKCKIIWGAKSSLGDRGITTGARGGATQDGIGNKRT